MPIVIIGGQVNSGVTDEQDKTHAIMSRGTAGGSFHILLAIDGPISHLYTLIQSGMV